MPPVYVLLDKKLKLIKLNQQGMLCIFDNKAQANNYMKSFVDVEGNGIELVERNMDFTKVEEN